MKKKKWKKEREGKTRDVYRGLDTRFVFPASILRKHCIEGGIKKRKRKGWKERRSKKLERKGGARDVDRGLVTRGQTTASSAFLSTFRPHYVYITTHVHREYTLRILLNTIQVSSILVDIPCPRSVPGSFFCHLHFHTHEPDADQINIILIVVIIVIDVVIIYMKRCIIWYRRCNETLPKSQRTHGIKYFYSFNTLSSKHMLQQALISWSNLTLVLFGNGREIHRTTLTNPR